MYNKFFTICFTNPYTLVARIYEDMQEFVAIVSCIGEEKMLLITSLFSVVVASVEST